MQKKALVSVYLMINIFQQCHDGEEKRKKRVTQKEALKGVLSLRYMQPLFLFLQHSTQMWCGTQYGISKKVGTN